jgi:hypothetical protein
MINADILRTLSCLNPDWGSSFYPEIPQKKPAIGEDVAWSLSRIPVKGPSYFVRLKWAGQEMWAPKAAKHLEYAMYNRLGSPTIDATGWRVTMVAGISKAAIWEHCGNTLCPTCNGKGDFKHGELILTCTVCGGFGTVSVKHERHKIFDMDVYEWREWEGLYLVALKILDDWENMVVSALKRDFWYLRGDK